MLFAKKILLNFECFGQFNWRSVCRRIRTDVTDPQVPSGKSDCNFAKYLEIESNLLKSSSSIGRVMLLKNILRCIALVDRSK